MIFHRQYGKRNCGQIAVATLAEVNPKIVEKIIGHSHGTQTKELIAALCTLGLEPLSDKCIPVRLFPNPPQFALCQLHADDRAGWHWIALGYGCIFDGNETQPIERQAYVDGLRGFAGNRRITSYLPVRKS